MTDTVLYTSAQAADQLRTDAKTLRRFLRATPEWSNPGSGGRYAFEASDIKAMRKQFPAWLADQSTGTKSAKPKTRAKIKITATGKPKVVPADLPPVDTSESPEVWDGPLPDVTTARIVGAERARRLDARLRATGVHISQLPAERFTNA
jgi:hypothetical protein